jgi:hypothetical protein
MWDGLGFRSRCRAAGSAADIQDADRCGGRDLPRCAKGLELIDVAAEASAVCKGVGAGLELIGVAAEACRPTARPERTKCYDAGNKHQR